MDLLTKTSDLAALCERLARSPYVAVDTEFMRDTTYWPKLCLVQIAPPEGEAVLIDPLAEGLDLAPFFELMANEEVVKVFHAARQDVEIVFTLGGLIPHPLFDTQVAAAVCGFGESVGYEALVRQLAGAQIDKTHRFTDWARRPLNEAQLHYAAEDVTHLRPVYEALAAQVDRLGRAEWIREEMDILTSPGTYRTEPEDAWKRLKMKARKPRELAVLKQVAAWREREAQSRNVPRSRVLKDDAIYEIATHAPDGEAALGRLRTIPNGFERSATGREIVRMVSEVRERPAEELPPLPRVAGPHRASGPVADLLKVLLKGVSEENKVASRLIATSDDVEAIAADDEADVAALRGWRRDIFGEKALALKAGRLALSIHGERVVLEDREPGEAPPKPARKPRRRRRGRPKETGEGS